VRPRASLAKEARLLAWVAEASAGRIPSVFGYDRLEKFEDSVQYLVMSRIWGRAGRHASVTGSARTRLLHTLGRLLRRRPTRPADQRAGPRAGGGRGWVWLVLIVVGFMAGVGGQAVQVPAPYLLAALVVGAVAALSGLMTAAFPRRAYRASQAMVGVLMGSYLDPAALRVAARSMLPLTAVSVATVVLSVGVAFLFFRCSLINRATATLGMVPGGSAAIMAAAEDLGADSRLVALAQYFRVGVIAVTAPLIVSFLSPYAFRHPHSIVPVLMAWHPVGGTHQVAGLVTLGAVVLLGTRLGNRLSLPAPFVLGPMLVTAVAIFTGAAKGFAPAGPLQNLAFACVGLEIGLRFSRESLQHARRHIARLIGGTLTVIVACFLLAWPLAIFAHLSFTDAYMATTPGGINAILATAVAIHANVALISSVQSLRLFGVVALATPLIRWILVRTSDARPARGRHAPTTSGRRTCATAAYGNARPHSMQRLGRHVGHLWHGR
jgi:membrane AbrB-like protein